VSPPLRVQALRRKRLRPTSQENGTVSSLFTQMTKILHSNDGRLFTLSSFEIRILSLNFFPFIQSRGICDSSRSGGVPRGGVAASRDASGVIADWRGRAARNALGRCTRHSRYRYAAISVQAYLDFCLYQVMGRDVHFPSLFRPNSFRFSMASCRQCRESPASAAAGTCVRPAFHPGPAGTHPSAQGIQSAAFRTIYSSYIK
jgi:hypothetical protein